MATTTNYGWTTPDDTALVKDGAAAIRTLGSSVDTTTKALNPETTLGDIAYRSSTANVKTRLGLGTAGQVLQVNSGANAPEWATFSSGSMTLLNAGGTTLSGATVTISAIDQTYQNLYFVVRNFLPATDTRLLNIRLNGSSSGFANLGSDAVDDFDPGADSIELGAAADNAVATFSTTIGTIFDYANTTTGKLVQARSVNHNPTTSANFNFVIRNGFTESTSAITSIVFRSTSGNMTSGTLFLYGVK
jgi:hypothetical protein